MLSPPPLFKRVETGRPGQSPLRTFAHEVGTLQCYLDQVTNWYGGNHPSVELQWDVYKQVLQTLSWLREYKGLDIPPVPTVPSEAPPKVALAMARDWLLAAEIDDNRKGTEPITATDQDNEEDMIDCATAAQVWQRSPSWWRGQVGVGKPITKYRTAGRTKLFRRIDAERLAKDLGIAKRQRAS